MPVVRHHSRGFQRLASFGRRSATRPPPPYDQHHMYISGAHYQTYICGSNCVLYIIWPPAYGTVRKSYCKSICPAGALKIYRSDCVRRAGEQWNARTRTRVHALTQAFGNVERHDVSSELERRPCRMREAEIRTLRKHSKWWLTECPTWCVFKFCSRKLQ